MSKLLSIIIPTYNMEKYLDKGLDSLIVSEKLWGYLEVLIINDGSKDKSSDIAHRYEQKNPELFRVIDKENGNYGSCINRGIKEASGKYIKIMDADDSFDKDGLENVLLSLIDVDADLILTKVIFVIKGREKNSDQEINLEPNKEYHFSDPLVKNILNDIAMHNVMYKKAILDKINYKQQEGISYTDQEWIYTPMVAVNSVLYLNETVYRYLIGREGQTMNPSVQLRKIDDTKKGIIRQADIYELCKAKNIDAGHLKYLELKAVNRARNFYRYCLLYNSNRIQNNYVKSFDKELLLHSRTIYLLLNKEYVNNYFKFAFIKCWRDSGKINPFIIFVVNLLKTLKNIMTQISEKRIV